MIKNKRWKRFLVNVREKRQIPGVSTCCMGKLTASSFNSPTFSSLYFKIRPGDVHVELLIEAVELLVEPVESPLETVESLLEFVH